MKKHLLFSFLGLLLQIHCSIAQTRVTGGYDLDIDLAPWQVLLKDGDKYICGGSIIAENYILTAKHCFEDVNIPNLRVIAGVSCKYEITLGNMFSVSNVILHPTLDVALISLSSHIPFNSKMQSISFVESLKNSFYDAGNAVRVSGWGWLTPNGFDPANCLNAVDVHIIGNREAGNMLGRVISDDELATTGVGSVRQGACHGDSGGPLSIWSDALQKNILLGVVSWGRPGCVGNNQNSPTPPLTPPPCSCKAKKMCRREC